MLESPMDMGIFCEHVVLVDEKGHHLVHGKRSYAAFWAGLRMARALTMAHPKVKVLSCRYNEARAEIVVRLSVVTEAPLGMGGMDPIHFDAVSVYKLNALGLISEHKIDNVIRNDLFGRLVPQGLPNLVSWGQPVAAPS